MLYNSLYGARVHVRTMSSFDGRTTYTSSPNDESVSLGALWMVIYGQWGRLRVILPKMLHLLGLNLHVISLALVILGGTGQCWGFDIGGRGHSYD